MREVSTLWFPALVALMLQGLFVGLEVTPVLDGGLYGPDSYMRLVRVGELAEHGRWFDKVMPRSNAPFGEELHWTRLFDVLLLAVAAPLMPVLGVARSLHFAGVVVSPLLELAAIAVLLWAARPFFDLRGRLFLTIIFLCQPPVFYSFIAGRADHHSLMSLLFAASVGLTLRLLARPFDVRLCLVAGAVLALDLWVSVESLAATALMLLALGLMWIWRGGDDALKSLVIALVLWAGTGLALLLDPPGEGWAVAVYDRLSLAQVMPFGFVALFWVVALVLERWRPAGWPRRARATLGVAGVLLVTGAVWLTFPKLMGGPFVELDPRLITIHWSLVQESRPLLAADHSSLQRIVYWLGLAVVGFPYLAYRCLRAGDDTRPLWLYLAGASALYLGFTLYQLRWTTYLDLLLVFPATGVLVAALGWLDRHLGPLWRAPARALVVTAFSIGFVVLGAVAQRGAEVGADVGAGGEAAGSGGGGCPITRFAEYAGGPAVEGAPQRIVANVFFGPELLYRTPHEVLAAPYPRRAAAGMWDAYAIMTAADDETAQALVRSRGVTWVLICPGPEERVLYRPLEPGPTFHARLARGEVPAWLRPLALPPELGAFRLFEVVG